MVARIFGAEQSGQFLLGLAQCPAHRLCSEPPLGAAQLFPRGLTIADSAENAQSSLSNGAQFGYMDAVLPALCQAPDGSILAPLDEAGSAAMGAPIMTLAQLAVTPNPRGVGF
jgi:hypothetical protein